MAAIFQLEDKRYRVQIRRAGLPTRSRIFQTKREAQQWAASIEGQIKSSNTDGYIQPLATTTIQKLINAYIEEVPNIGRSKLAYLKSIGIYYKDTPLRKFSSIHMMSYVEKRLKDKVAGVSLAGEISALSSVLKWAKHAKRLDINPDIAKDARSALSARDIDTRGNDRERLMSPEEHKKLMKHYASKPMVKTNMPMVINFALLTTMRLGEICRIRIEDLDRDNKTIIIRDRKHPRKKLGNHQVVPLINGAYEIALQMAGDRTEGQLFKDHTEDAVGASFTRAVSKLKLGDLHFHDLRHTGITELFKQGLSIQLVAVLSGHSDWKMLKRYSHISANDVHAFVDNLKK